jgi:hypothetical protein
MSLGARLYANLVSIRGNIRFIDEKLRGQDVLEPMCRYTLDKEPTNEQVWSCIKEICHRLDVIKIGLGIGNKSTFVEYPLPGYVPAQHMEAPTLQDAPSYEPMKIPAYNEPNPVNSTTASTLCNPWDTLTCDQRMNAGLALAEYEKAKKQRMWIW